MTLSVDAIAYQEIISKGEMGVSPVEEFAYPDPPDVHCRTKKVFECAWADRASFLRTVLGYAARSTQNGHAFLSRALPMGHPDWQVSIDNFSGENALTTRPPGLIPYLWANKATIRGYGADQSRPAGRSRMLSPQNTAVYNLARWEVEFLGTPYPMLTDQQMSALGYKDANGLADESFLTRYVTILPKMSGRFMGLGQAAAQGFRYANDPPGNSLVGTPVQQAPGKIQSQADLEITHWRVPEACAQTPLLNPSLWREGQPGAIENCQGKVNLSPFANAPAGTLLYLGAAFKRFIDPFGMPTYDITHHFQYVNYRHNYVPAFCSMAALTPPTLSWIFGGGGGNWQTLGDYYYQIVTVGSGGSLSAPSNEIQVDITAPTQSINLSWNAVAGASGYFIYRSPVSGGEAVSPALIIAAYGGTTTTATDTGLPVGNGFAAPYPQSGNAQLRYVEISTDGLTHAVTDPTTGVHIYDAVDFRPLFRSP